MDHAQQAGLQLSAHAFTLGHDLACLSLVQAAQSSRATPAVQALEYTLAWLQQQRRQQRGRVVTVAHVSDEAVMLWFTDAARQSALHHGLFLVPRHC